MLVSDHARSYGWSVKFRGPVLRESLTIAPGANVLVRDETWRVRKVERASNGQQVIHATGISELVRDKEAIFVREIEERVGGVQVLAPETTKIVRDQSSGYRASLLYMESLLRQIPPTDAELHVGHLAAMDVLDFQLEPALMALEKPRQRILIADAVGLGKTLEAGILLSELIRRGRGKRILVVAIKSMLTQFQKEMWTRFTIPLVRLDSVGLQRIRANIPTNQNPFYYYDRAIISIDTLKQNNEYRVHLEKAHWDVIVIDEAHNVAARGKNRSQRSELAELLAHRSDTLIMLSATPHDGSAASFASLMNMLDPTAIADPESYGPEDIDGLYVRRFKKDIHDQVKDSFPDREILRAASEATEVEEGAYDELVALQFTELDRRKSGNMLFKTALEKALMSSPAACLQTIDNRIRTLHNDETDRYVADVAALQVLRNQVTEVTPEGFSKYQKLIDVLQNHEHFRFTGHLKTDRLVVFTERIETMKFLAEHLIEDLGLDAEKVAVLHGSMSDQEQQEVVEQFGQANSRLRLLIASDVASEGINLHYQCHRMIHFDIPWSLMTFQQRNGRIDRYGQREVPRILYLYTESQNEKLRGDLRILELLIAKDEQATKNIGDPSALQDVYDVDAQEAMTADAIERGISAEEFDDEQEQRPMNMLEKMLRRGQEQQAQKRRPSSRTRASPSLFASNYAYVEAALDLLRQSEELSFQAEPDEKLLRVHMPQDLCDRFELLPKEIEPADGIVVLTEDSNRITEAIEIARTEESAWPAVHYLWPLNPVVGWVNDRITGNFGRHTAPVITLHEGLAPDEVVFVTSGLIPNRKSQPLIHRWFAVVFRGGEFERVEPFEALRARTGLGAKKLTNPDDELDLSVLEAFLPDVVKRTRETMQEVHREFRKELQPKLDEQVDRLGLLEQRQLAHLDLVYEGKTGPRAEQEKGKARRAIEATFEDFVDWVTDSLTTEDQPFVQVVAVMGAGASGV